MSVELQLGAITLTAVGLLVGGAWGLAKLIMMQFDRGLDARFDALEKARSVGAKVWHDRISKSEAKIDQLEVDLRRVMMELPREYVNRSDYVRRETVIEAKIDQLGLRMQNWILESKRD